MLAQQPIECFVVDVRTITVGFISEMDVGWHNLDVEVAQHLCRNVGNAIRYDLNRSH